MAKKKEFRELLAKLPPEAQEEIAASVQKTLANMSLDELRAARELTQVHLAELLGVNQAAISKMERRADMYISTLARFIEAMGGKLEIRAVFPDGAVVLDRLASNAGAEGR